MYDSLPQLSEATRLLLGKEIDAFSKLAESEAQNQVNQELAQLEQTNKWIAGAVSFITYCVEQVDESVEHDSDIPGEVKTFWGTMGPYIKTRVLKATLILLQAIDRELWVKGMQGRVKDVGEIARQ